MMRIVAFVSILSSSASLAFSVPAAATFVTKKEDGWGMRDHTSLKAKH
jgi:hypothetical protein